jgi:hypothetical protein
MKLNAIREIVNKDYSDIISEEEEEIDNSQDKSNLNNTYETAGKYRFEKETSTATAHKRKSIDSSNILSNISLQEVFDSSMKLINKNNTNELFYNENNNIIIEEDSNLNLNTLSLNLRTNLNNNFDLEFEDENENEIIYNNFNNNLFNIDLIKEELENVFQNLKKRKRKSVRRSYFTIPTIAEEIKSNMNIKSLDFPMNELESIIFYQSLLSAQAGKIEILQEKPFDNLYM